MIIETEDRERLVMEEKNEGYIIIRVLKHKKSLLCLCVRVRVRVRVCCVRLKCNAMGSRGQQARKQMQCIYGGVEYID